MIAALLAVPGLAGLPAFAGTFALHAVGIDSSKPTQNAGIFYDEAKAFNDYCKQSKDTQCQLFIDPDPKKRDPGSNTDLTGLGNGPAHSKQVKDAFIAMLDQAKPGDNVVFTVTDHGWVEGQGNYPAGDDHWYSHDTSCVALAGFSDAICADDIARILKSHKKPGVKVFIAAQACESGAFASLSGPEVCTYVGSDRSRLGADGDQFWLNVKRLKKPGQALTLGDIKLRGHWSVGQKRGGGFGSQTIQSQLCGQKEGGPTLYFKNEEKVSVGQLAAGGLGLNKSIAKNFCRFDGTEKTWNVVTAMSQSVARITDAFGLELPLVAALKAERCQNLYKQTRLCAAIAGFERSADKYDAYAKRVTAIIERSEARKGRIAALDEALEASPPAGKAAELRAERGRLLDALYKERADTVREIRDTYPKNDDQFLLDYNTIAQEFCVELPYPGGPVSRRNAYTLDGKDRPGGPVTQADQVSAQSCEDNFGL